MTLECNAGAVPVRKMSHQEFLDACTEFGESWSSTFSVEWENGGNRCDCWGGNYALEHEDEKELEDLDAFLLKYFPQLSYLQYNAIERRIEETDRSDSDWYGGVQFYKGKFIAFDTLEDELIDLGVLEIIA